MSRLPAGLFFFLTLMVSVSAFADESTAPITNGQRILTCAHSFHWFVPPILQEIAPTAGITGQQIVGLSQIGGSMVIQHWNVPDAENIAKRVLTAGGADVLTLSPIWLPDEGMADFARLGLAHNPDIRVTVLEFWLPNDTFQPVYPLQVDVPVDHNAATVDELKKQQVLYNQSVEDLIRSLNKEFGKEVVYAVPSGDAVIALREKIIAGEAPGLKTQEELFVDSWGHPHEMIQVLSAYCHFAVIYRRSPVGLPVPPTLTKDKSVPPDQWEALNRLLQELAWQAVIKNPLSGVRP